MTQVRDILKRKGGLILSPAVLPGEKPISSSAGMENVASVAASRQRSDVQTVAADANGEAQVIFSGPPSDYKWRVERAAIGSIANNFQTCEVHAGDFKSASPFDTLVDFSDIPNVSVADENATIYVGPGQNLLFRFIGGNTGDDATARIQYTEEPL